MSEHPRIGDHLRQLRAVAHEVVGHTGVTIRRTLEDGVPILVFWLSPASADKRDQLVAAIFGYCYARDLPSDFDVRMDATAAAGTQEVRARHTLDAFFRSLALELALKTSHAAEWRPMKGNSPRVGIASVIAAEVDAPGASRAVSGATRRAREARRIHSWDRPCPERVPRVEVYRASRHQGTSSSPSTLAA